MARELSHQHLDADRTSGTGFLAVVLLIMIVIEYYPAGSGQNLETVTLLH